MGFFQLGPLADAAVLHDPARFVDAIFERWSPGGGASPAHRAEVAACLRTSMPEPVAMYRAQMGRASDVAAEFERLDGPSGHIHVPTLYLHGDRDGCIGVDHVHGQASRFPAGHETQIVEGAGHFLTLDAPKAVSRHLEAFVGTA